jgi:ABC-2 type transport system permease protein
MPKAAQWLAEIFPLTHFLRLIRGIMLREAHLGEMWIELVALAAFVVVVMGIAVARFRKTLD